MNLLAAPFSVELATVCLHLQIKSLIIVESQSQTVSLDLDLKVRYGKLQELKNQWSIMPRAEDSDAEMNEHDQHEIWRNIVAV